MNFKANFPNFHFRLKITIKGNWCPVDKYLDYVQFSYKKFIRLSHLL